jgi:hypothetical protein
VLAGRRAIVELDGVGQPSLRELAVRKSVVLFLLAADLDQQIPAHIVTHRLAMGDALA